MFLANCKQDIDEIMKTCDNLCTKIDGNWSQLVWAKGKEVEDSTI